MCVHSRGCGEWPLVLKRIVRKFHDSIINKGRRLQLSPVFVKTMVIIHLSNIEALQLSKKLRLMSDNIEIDAIKEDRAIDSAEDLVITALCEIFEQTKQQLDNIPNKKIIDEQKDYNREFSRIQAQQAKQN